MKKSKTSSSNKSKEKGKTVYLSAREIEAVWSAIDSFNEAIAHNDNTNDKYMEDAEILEKVLQKIL